MRPLAVIIPVYNAFGETQRCLETVLEHSPAGVKVVVLDDASPQGVLRDFFPSTLVSDPRVTVQRNPQNLGFVGTCNRGMTEFAARDDVILLNSDTEVTARWIEKLQRAAYHRSQVGTVTPFTNNGVICSIPKFCLDNDLPAKLSLTEFAEIVERTSRREYPELPTAVGFCMYIKRELIDKIGILDQEAFGKGYGEENDFCCRAKQAGYLNVLDDATFIYHKGSLSFKASKAELCRRNEEVLRSRYPDYYPSVAAFCSAKPLKPLHRRILDEMTSVYATRSELSVLHILHNGPFREHWHAIGGTELHVQDLITQSPKLFHWTLVPRPRGFVLGCHFESFEREIELPQNFDLDRILRRDLFDVVHVHHTRGFNRAVLVRALRAHGNYLISLHDYSWLCGRIFMLTPKLLPCEGHECVTECKFRAQDVERERRLAKELLAGAARVVAFSRSTQEIVARVLGVRPSWQIIPHGIQGSGEVRGSAATEDLKPHEALRVVFVGHLPDHKGGRIVKEVTRRDMLPVGSSAARAVEWHVVGKMYDTVPQNVQEHGIYPRGGLAAVLAAIRPHVAVIPSICPETYSITLDELWHAGVPVICAPIGAPAERINKSGAGWVMPEASADGLMLTLARIAGSPEEYRQACSKVAMTSVRTAKEEAEECAGLYAALSVGPRARVEKLLPELGELVVSMPEPGIRDHVAGVLNRTVGMIERAGLRPLVKDLAHRLVPPSFLEKVRRWRGV